MGDLEIRDWLALGGFFVSLAGLWYKIHNDTQQAIGSAIKSVDEKTNKKLEKLQEEIDLLRDTSVTKLEHSKEVERLSQDMRAFKDEVKHDIRNLNSNLTTRLDVLMQRFADNRIQ